MLKWSSEFCKTELYFSFGGYVMLILKVDMKDMNMVGGLTEFIEEVFIKRNWDLYLILVLKANKEDSEPYWD